MHSEPIRALASLEVSFIDLGLPLPPGDPSCQHLSFVIKKKSLKWKKVIETDKVKTPPPPLFGNFFLSPKDYLGDVKSNFYRQVGLLQKMWLQSMKLTFLHRAR